MRSKRKNNNNNKKQISCTIFNFYHGSIVKGRRGNSFNFAGEVTFIILNLCWYCIPPCHSTAFMASVRSDQQNRFDLFLGVAGVGADEEVEICEVEERLVLVKCHLRPMLIVRRLQKQVNKQCGGEDQYCKQSYSSV
jgi:hypothetical protein